MEKRYSSPCLADLDFHPRPKTYRKRSNSFPIIDALGCSTPEAKIIMAEGRAAVRSRQASIHRRGRRRPSHHDEVYRPRNHLRYLNGGSSASPIADDESFSTAGARSTRHARIPSNATDGSTSTVVLDRPQVDPKVSAGETPGSPLEDYSATLARFIKSQLESIPSYQPGQKPISPRSCPNLSPRLPVNLIKKRKGIDSIVEIPPIRPPMQSAFSAWSSTDDETDEGEDRVPPIMPSVGNSTRHTPASNNYTPSILSFYETSDGSTFLFTSTPLDEENSKVEVEEDPLTARGFAFPDHSTLPGVSSPARSLARNDDGYLSSALSTHAQLSSSSAHSLSSTSTTSYFECKPPVPLVHAQVRVVAAVTANQKGQHLTASSPFEGDALANVHDILVESRHRVLVDGMPFDMLRDFSMPEETIRVSTPC